MTRKKTRHLARLLFTWVVIDLMMKIQQHSRAVALII